MVRLGMATTCPRARVAPAQTRRRAAALADTRGAPRWPMYTITRLYRTARAPDMVGAGGCTKHARGRCAITSLGLESMDTLGFEPRALRIRSGCDTTTPGADAWNNHRSCAGAAPTTTLYSRSCPIRPGDDRVGLEAAPTKSPGTSSFGCAGRQTAAQQSSNW